MKNLTPIDISLCICCPLIISGVSLAFISIAVNDLAGLAMALIIMALLCWCVGSRYEEYAKEKDSRRIRPIVYPIQKINPVTIRVEQVNSTYSSTSMGSKSTL